MSAEITLETAALRRALGHISRVVESRTTIPIVGNVLVEPAPEGVAIHGTDMDMAVTARIATEVEPFEPFTLPAHRLTAVVGRVSGEHVKIASSGAGYRVASGSARFNLPTLPAGDFPRPPEMERPTAFAIAAADLLRLMAKTAFAISDEASRYYLNGIHLHIVDEGHLRAVATNGHILARTSMPAPEIDGEMPGVIIPRKMVATLIRALAGLDGDVPVAISPNRIEVTLAGLSIQSRLIDGTFPDYERVIPADNPHSVPINVAALKDAIERVRVVGDDKARAISMETGADAAAEAINTFGAVTLRAVGGTGADAEEHVEVDEIPASPIRIGFASSLLLEHLGALTGDEVTLQIGDPASPVVVRDSGDPDWLGILMPMRI